MNKILLFNAVILTLGFLGGSSVYAVQWPWENNPSKAIPPTPAIMNVTTSNSTIQADTWNEVLHFIGLRGINIFGSNLSKTVYFNVTIADENGTNLGTGAKVFKNETNHIWYFRTLHNGTNIAVTQNSTGITISGTGTGESTTASNLGTSGQGVFSSLVGFDLQFKKLLAGAGISLSANSTNVIITNNATSSGFTKINNLDGGDAKILATNSSLQVTAKTLTAGSGVTITNGSKTITIAVAAGTDTNTAQIASAGGTSIWKERNNATKNTLYGLDTSRGISFFTDTNTININTNFKVNSATCSAGQHLFSFTNSTTGIGFTCTTDATTTAITKANNLDGGDAKIFATNSTTQVTAKTLTNGAGISITNGSKTLTISSTITQGYTKANNLDGGTAKLFATNSSNQVTAKTLTAGTGITITNGSKTLTIDSTITQGFTKINNFGTGDAAIVATNASNTANIKKLVAGTGISLTNGSSTVTITSTVSGGITKANNLDGGDAKIFATNSSNQVTAKTLTAGTNIAITNGSKTLTITGTNTAQIASAGGTSLFKQRDNATQNTIKGLTTTRGITLTGNTNDVQVDTNFKVNTKSSATRQFLVSFNNATTSGDFGTTTFGANTITCGAGSHLFSYTNSTGAFTCTADTGGTAYTKINNLDGGDAKIVATNSTLSNTQATFKTLTNGAGITITNGSKTLTISSSITQGKTETNSIEGGTARLLKSNSTTEDVFKSLTGARGINITNGTNTITIDAPLKVANQTVSNDFQIVGINNSTGIITRNQFSVNTQSCSAGQHVSSITNTTGYVTCSADSGTGFTTIEHISSAGDASEIFSNSSNKAVFKKLSGTANNVTISGNSTGILTWNLGSNVVVTGGSSQTVNKILYHNGFGANYTKTSSATSDMGTKGVVLVVDAGTGNRTVNLPTATSNTGQIFVIMRNDTSPARTNMVKIDPSGSEKIDGALNYNLTRNGQTLMIQSIGSANKDWTMVMESGKPNNLETAFVKGSIMNRWYSSMVAQGTTSTTTQRASVMTATPLVLGTRTTFDQIQIDVTTLKAASTCRAAIYNDNGNGYPMNLISGSDVSTISTAGAGRVGNTFTAPITLNSGLYWLAFQCSGGGQVLRAWTNTQIAPVLGYVSTSTASSITTGYNVTQTYAAMPSNFPANTVTTTTHNPAMVLVRAIG